MWWEIGITIVVIILVIGAVLWFTPVKYIPFSISGGDWANLNLSCPKGKTMTIDEARYGNFLPGSTCQGISVLDKFIDLCAGERSCKLGRPMHEIAGDPCPFIDKQIAGKYHCK